MMDTQLGTCGNGRFHLLRRIGAGGMGIVYEALDSSTGNRVALKTLKEIDAASIYRIKWEFRSLAQIYHPNLAQLYELFSDDGSWFFTMELVEDCVDFLTHVRAGAIQPMSEAMATTVIPDTSDVANQRLAKTSIASRQSAMTATDSDLDTHRIVLQPPPCNGEPDRIRDCFRQLAEGVAALHRMNRLHRDLKPGNALVTPSGRVVVLDFGLVAELDTPSGFRSTLIGESDSGQVLGTAAWMAPEQAAGLNVTPAADWYSVGVMLFQALTGQLPFTGKVSQMLRDKQTRDAPAPSQLVNGIPDDLDALCRELLQRDPSSRPTGAEILARLAPARAAPSTEAALPPQTSVVFVGRRPELSALSEALAVAREGATVVCHLQGPSGSGKTTLIERFIKQANAEGALVLNGRCYENESVPYKGLDALVDALTRHLLRLPDDDLKAAIPSTVASLAQMFPVLERLPHVRHIAASSPATADPIEGRQTAFAVLRSILKRLTLRRSLMLVIDDLHWGDHESAALLGSLMQGADAPPMLLLFSYRSEYLERSECLRELAKPMATGSRVLRRDIVVGGFSPNECRTLAKALLSKLTPDAERHIEWVAAESRGSALFVNELVRHAASGTASGSLAAAGIDEVIWRRIEALPDEARAVLTTAAVAGRPLRLIDLQRSLGLQDLPLKALSQLRSDRLLRLDGLRPEQMLEPFHDRVRETIVAHLDADRLRERHHALARALESGGAAEAEVLADHFARAERLDKASHYALLAADQAMRKLAFEHAEQFYRRAAEWAQDISDRIEIADRLIHFYTDLARFSDAYAIASDAVRLLGGSIPASFSALGFAPDWLLLKLRLRGIQPEQLLDAPMVADQRIESIIRLMNAVAKAAYQVRPELCVWIAVKLVLLHLKHGNTRDCAIGYMVYGVIFTGGVRGDYAAGFTFGKLALALVERFRNDKQRAEVNFVVGYFGTSWMRPAIEAERLWKVAYDAGIASGDLFHTGCAAAATLMGMLMRGAPFAEILARAKEFEQVLGPAGLHEPLGVLSAVRQTVRNLAGETVASQSFSGEGFDEEDFVATLPRFGSRHFVHCYFIAKMQTLLLWGHHARAAAMLEASARYQRDSQGLLHQAEYTFYEALVRCESGRSAPASQRAELRAAVAGHRRLQAWAQHCPENFSAREALVAAEIARTRRQTARAHAQYERAVEAAGQYGQVHLEGIARLLLAGFLADQSRWDEAKRQRLAAAECLRAWGATALATFVTDGAERPLASQVKS